LLKPIAFTPVIEEVSSKGNVHPITGHEGPEVEKKYSSTLSLTRRYMGVGGQSYVPAA